MRQHDGDDRQRTQGLKRFDHAGGSLPRSLVLICDSTSDFIKDPIHSGKFFERRNFRKWTDLFNAWPDVFHYSLKVTRKRKGRVRCRVKNQIWE